MSVHSKINQEEGVSSPPDINTTRNQWTESPESHIQTVPPGSAPSISAGSRAGFMTLPQTSTEPTVAHPVEGLHRQGEASQVKSSCLGQDLMGAGFLDSDIYSNVTPIVC